MSNTPALRHCALTLLASLLFSPFLSQAQEFWGMTTDGGANGVGTIFSISPGGTYSNEYDFPKTEGGLPKGQFYRANSGLVYGVTELGGVNGGGILFEFDANSGDIIVRHNFDSPTGQFPIRGVTEASNGKIYGTTSSGGANGFGVLFEYDPVTEAYAVMVDFAGTTNGSVPNGQLFTHSNGTIYGTCWTGGPNNLGTLFSYVPGASSVSVLHNFTILTGGRAYAGVEQDGNKLIGVAQLGGPTPTTPGVLFEYDLSTSTYTVLHDFDTADGTSPIGGISSSGGTYYGTTSSGGDNGQGTLFSYSNAVGYQKLFDFNLTTGAVPIGKPLATTNGTIVGLTSKGSTNDDGVLYEYSLNNSSYSILADLANAGLEVAWGGVTELPNGDLIGMTKDGGNGNSGGAFLYNSTNGISKQTDFGYSQAGRPFGRLIEGPNSLLYGMTSIGGTQDEGTLFSFNPSNGIVNVLWNFGGSTFGGFPEGTLAENQGILYGTTTLGGSSGGGTVFKYDLNTSTYTKLANLSSATGTEPRGQLERASNGNYYATCTAGGTLGLGTIIELNPTSSTVTKMHDFDGTDGSNPIGDLLAASNGSLYGVTNAGGADDEGVLYEFTTGGAFAKLFDFASPVGANPSGKLWEDNGVLYGTTATGASVSFSGGIFSWDIVGSSYNQEVDFNGSNGDDSRSNLTPDANGFLWGTCKAGGSGPVLGYGTIFRMNPATSVITLMHDYVSIADGIRPTNGLLFVAPQTSITLDLKVCLQGPYNGSDMNDALRSIGSFPTTEPYSGLGFTQVGDGGGESISSSVLSTSGSNAIVDWILVELRDKSNNASIINTRSALLQKDGDIVDLDGSSLLSMSVPADDYFIAVRHRNHFGVMSGSTVSLNTSGPATVDFTNPATNVFGTNAQSNQNGTMCMWSGNSVTDNTIKYTGSSNDRDPILVKVGGSVPTATVADYSTEDVNLDGVIKYTGSANDRDPILVNIGGSVPTATLLEQLP